MPRIADRALDGVVYLYHDRQHAELGREFGGSGFIAGVASERLPKQVFYQYIVSNWHVVARDGCPVVRMNFKDGTPDIHEFEPHEWEFIPGIDVAVVPVHISDRHSITTAAVDCFLTEEKIKEHDIGPGEDVVMIGRFIDHDGGATNKPAVRFGCVSVMPTPIRQKWGWTANSYCIDLHSRNGFSGAPVFAYRLPLHNLGNAVTDSTHTELRPFFGLLGIHWGQFPELWEIKNKSNPDTSRMENATPLVAGGHVVEGFSGMTCVIPAGDILKVLNTPKLRSERDRWDDYWIQRFAIDGMPPMADVTPFGRDMKTGGELPPQPLPAIHVEDDAS
jgi:hypothetical protein